MSRFKSVPNRKGEKMQKAKKIIIVDDNAANLSVGRNLLKSYYEVFPVPSAARLFDLLSKFIPDLILLDVNMPEMSGYEAIVILKTDPRYMEIPIVFLTAKNDEESEMEGFDLGAADYITKPFSGPLLLRRIANQLLLDQQKRDLIESRAALQDYTDNLEVMVRDKTTEIFNLQNAVLATVADLVEFRDRFTGGHITRTQRYLQVLVNELQNKGEYTDEISKWNPDFFLPSAQLHDVGKIAISDLILNKPTKLTQEEFDTMKTHVVVGVEAVKKIIDETTEHAFLNHALLFVGAHHEKWDGSGYPNGLKGLDIPLEGRLMAIADVYDALISERPYKRAFSHEKACKIIEDGSGSHFDPILIEVFKTVKDEFDVITKESV